MLFSDNPLSRSNGLFFRDAGGKNWLLMGRLHVRHHRHL
jgi:hypothetical protein